MYNSIGECIAVLRRKKGITQEQLGIIVGVSGQAVSKWENGGMPDSELLPRIADALGVTIDELFGRGIINHGQLESAIFKYISEIEPGCRFKEAMNLCWSIESSLEGFDISDEQSSYIPFEEFLSENTASKERNEPVLSAVVNNQGVALMSPVCSRPFFLLISDYDYKENELINETNFIPLFKDLSNELFFKTMVFMIKRNSQKPFTPNLLVKNLGIDVEQAKDMIEALKKYKLISTRQVERDDELVDEYMFLGHMSDAAFTALLLFAKEFIYPTACRSLFSHDRNMPLL